MYLPTAGQLAFTQNGTQALLFSGSQAATFAGNVTLPTAGQAGWSTRTQLLAPSNGVLRITNAADSAPTTLAAGISIGTTSTGTSLVYDSTYGLRAMNNALNTNLGFAGVAFNALTTGNVIYGNNIGTGSQTGMGNPSLTSIAWYVSNTQYGLINSTGQWSNIRKLTTAKTANYTVLNADTGTTFTNDGASGSVQFTLPTAAQGLWYEFQCTAAQTLTVTTGAGSIFANGLTGATRTITGAANRYSCIRVHCYDGTNWVVASSQGVFT